jgi:hypothetical protein
MISLLDELLELAAQLGYQLVREARHHFFPPRDALEDAA